MPLPRRLLCLFSTLLLALPAILANAQAYTSIVVFGDSLSDTGNVAHLTQAKYSSALRVPSPVANYTDGRFTDGFDTSPAAHNYTGVWIEQLAATLPTKPVVKNSLDGGTDYAYGFGTTADSTSIFTFGPGNALSVPVNNLGQQVTDYLATKPTISNTSLFVVWGGANDLINSTSNADITNAASREVALVQKLIAAGATDFIVPNLPPLGAVPRFNGSPTTSAAATQAASGFNQALAAGLGALAAANPGKTLRIFQLDVFGIFNSAIGSPITGGFVNVTSSSRGNTTLNPDTYLFWDDLHPTTAGHHVLALAAAGLIVPPSLMGALSPTSVTIPRGSTGSSTVTLTPAGGFSGTAALACGTLPPHLSCTFSPASVSFTGTSAAQTSTLTIGTTAASANLLPKRPGSTSAAGIFSAFALFPYFGLAALAALRQRGGGQSTRLLVFFTVLSLAASLGLAGCGGSNNKAAAGSYTVPVNVTAGGSTSMLNLTVVVQ